MKLIKFLSILICACLFSTCVEVQNQYQVIPPGVWRATLNVSGGGAERFIDTDNETDRVFTELTDGELPFNFEVVYNSEEDIDIFILNAEERILVDDIEFGRDKETLEDTIRINFPLFDTYISGRYEENRIEGYWVVNYREQYSVPFQAEFGRDHRFTNLKKEPAADLSGIWETTFEIGTEYEYKGVGEFQQEGNHLTGTFRTETGDYRFLEGTVQANKAYLSCFDGSHAFLFQAKILEDTTLIGSFRSGKHYITTWEAKENEDFELSNPNDLTYIKGQEKFYFEFPDSDGRLVSMNDVKFAGKPLLVTIFGTWCPNCRDEMDFLKTYIEEHPELDFNVVGIAFERYRDTDKSMAAVKRYKDKMKLPFDLLYAGYYDKGEAVNQLPMLNKIISYPTLIYIDKEKNVRQIHTGFSGPATSKYESFTNEFDELVRTLVNE
ncbi:peroxiredoxin family protein [Portibacter marinus]|uniref:peroxiredoxin family protein n=1 Tax=Portibacter marinus TaxID=2898660 RepID=UPI001F30BFF3|nr:TlpA disulfide reductase family protein [Portibacter marinus]